MTATSVEKERIRRIAEADRIRAMIARAEKEQELLENESFKGLLADFAKAAKNHRESLCGSELNPFQQGRAQGALLVYTAIEARVSGRVLAALKEKLVEAEKQIEIHSLPEGGDSNDG